MAHSDKKTRDGWREEMEGLHDAADSGMCVDNARGLILDLDARDAEVAIARTHHANLQDVIRARDAEVAELRAKLATEREAREAAEREIKEDYAAALTEWEQRHAAALAAQKRAEARAEELEKAMRGALDNLRMLGTGGDYPETCRASAMFLLESALAASQPPAGERGGEK